MRRLAVLLVTLTLVPLAGCVGEVSSLKDRFQPDAEGAALAFNTEYDATGCREAGILILSTFEHAASFLPAGFEPADASGLFGLPIASGRAAFYVNAQECEGNTLEGGPSAEAQVNVYVKPPQAPGAPTSEAMDFYELWRGGAAGNGAAHFASAGWTGAVADIAVESASAPPEVTRLIVGVGDAAGVAWDGELQVAMENPLVGIGRFWRDLDAGLAYTDHHLDTVLEAGDVTCTFRAGFVAADAAGATTCERGEAMGLALPAFDYRATTTLLAGVHAGDVAE